MTFSEREVEVSVCDSCGELWLNPPDTTCCGEPVEANNATANVEPPELEQVMQEIFGMGSTDLEVCQRVMVAGETTVQELASQLEYDRTTVTRHLNHLVELGVVKKESQALPEGGRRHVYSPTSMETVRRQFKLGLYAWLADAEALVDEMSQEKIETMAERHGRAEVDDGPGRLLIGKLFGRGGSD